MDTKKIMQCKFYLKLDLDSKHFPLPLDVRFIDGKIWELVSPFTYVRDCREKIDVPTGYLTNMASIPKFAWGWIGSPTGEYGAAAVIHDWCCQYEPWPRAKSDMIFYEAMRDSQVSYFKRSIMYLAVRIWGIIIPTL